MKISFFPKTKSGSLSVVMFVILVVLLAYFFLMINVFDQRGGDTFFSNLSLTLPMIAAWACGAASFALGIIAIIKAKSRSVLVFAVTLLCALTTLYGIIEVVFPH